jgi:hypothetical protein
MIVPIAFAAIVITWLLRNVFERSIGEGGYMAIAGVEFVAILCGTYFHYSYFWNAGTAGKAVLGLELLNSTINTAMRN